MPFPDLYRIVSFTSAPPVNFVQRQLGISLLAGIILRFLTITVGRIDRVAADAEGEYNGDGTWL